MSDVVLQKDKLLEIFPHHEDCVLFLEKVFWNGKPQCSTCGSFKSTKRKREHRYHCNQCNMTYSVTANTVFHKTRIDLRKWFQLISLDPEEKKSVRELAKLLEVNRNTASLMITKLRDGYRHSPITMLKIVHAVESL